MKRKPWFSRKITTPLYGDYLTIGVANTCADFKGNLPKLFQGNDEWMEDFCGMTMYNGIHFAVLLVREDLTHNLVAHEVFHLTHRMLERRGEKFSDKHHEPFAYLQGWLAGQVYAQLNEHGFRVRYKD